MARERTDHCLATGVAADLLILPMRALDRPTSWPIEHGSIWLEIIGRLTYHRRTAVAMRRGEILPEGTDEPASRRPAQAVQGSDTAGAGKADPVAGAA